MSEPTPESEAIRVLTAAALDTDDKMVRARWWRTHDDGSTTFTSIEGNLAAIVDRLHEAGLLRLPPPPATEKVPCRSVSPDGKPCLRKRGHPSTQHSDGTPRRWTGGVRASAVWVTFDDGYMSEADEQTWGRL